ncbi:dATP/dGTP pyrophosphohydrolase domain-containing protein [Achromobacter ruhlandii]|uniref:dATP/dGTP pyrophosphohydrolase domain-containing protein n=1 Tax=Achromobacter ruhlandii TaxID=72557 RepID=UPI003B9D8B4E
MTQQDDITQRVLTDDEIQALWDEACKDSPQAPGWNRHIRFARALLSKLRAPVADERAATAGPWQAEFPRNRSTLIVWRWCENGSVSMGREYLRADGKIASTPGRFRSWNEAHAAIDRAALASAPVAVPHGWKLVPIKPTPEMEDAGCDVPCPQDDAPAPSTVYAAMIGAAPTAPTASAPVAKPKRAPLDDWRVQAIAECLETEWDDMTPAGAEADARLIVGYLIAYEKESDQIEARHAAEPVDPVVQAVRKLRASAPEAGEAVTDEMIQAGAKAAREYFERTGGNDPAVIYRAMRAAVPVAPQASAEVFDFVAHLARQSEFSARTFGPGARVAGVCDHIRKELIEVETSGGDLKEWVDVIILGLDGAWRSGATPQEIISAIVAKQAKNEARTWPDWRTVDPNKAIEHQRTAAPCTCPSGDGSLHHPCPMHPGADKDGGQQRAGDECKHARAYRAGDRQGYACPDCGEFVSDYEIHRRQRAALSATQAGQGERDAG